MASTKEYAYDFMELCGTACEVTLAQDRATIEAMPNGTECLQAFLRFLRKSLIS